MEELELRQYWNIIRKRWILVISIPIIAAIVSGVLSFFVLKPQYEADTTLLVNQKADSNLSLQYQTIMANQALVTTYSNIIKSRTIEQAVIDNLNLPYTVKQLDAMITVSSPNQSQVIDVKVVDGSQAEAARIANALASVFQSKAETLMDVKNVQVVDPAEVVSNPSPVKPNKKLNIAIAFILGLMVSVGIAFLLEYLDNRLRTEEDVTRYLGLPVLGAIVDYEDVE
ncbi:YveK family protein [Alicyclobacillus pomorum]|jgi:capsular polysaccharide biosynthesis protein|uniref:YveK family protein n=1 Tax=Alicyclobacillus pomorum TaxID=204470 RepID=UPI00042059D0|nr:Wzz/FepE/Etk N-terminal domain-containing protein [Alicyclobacillus pomorum]